MAQTNMRQEEFQKLLKRYQQGLCTPEEEKFIEKWFQAMGSADRPAFSISGKSAIKGRTWTRVQEHINRSRKTHGAAEKKFPMHSRTLLSIAATILLMLVSAVFLIVNDRQNNVRDLTRQIAEKTILNDSDTAMEVPLSDGSRVLLQPNSRISFKEPFGSHERHVSLEGEAFFTVARNVSRPFLVNTREVITKVLGTSFTVSAFPNEDNITVSVVTGKVSVMTRHDNHADSTRVKETILTPNQKITYDRNKHVVSRSIVQEPVPILPPARVRRMQFEAAPIKDIFEALEQVYGVDIDFNEDTFSSCLLTTSIAEGNIYNRLDMICKAIDAQYIVVENVIVITGRGCSP